MTTKFPLIANERSVLLEARGPKLFVKRELPILHKTQTLGDPQFEFERLPKEVLNVQDPQLPLSLTSSGFDEESVELMERPGASMCQDSSVEDSGPDASAGTATDRGPAQFNRPPAPRGFNDPGRGDRQPPSYHMQGRPRDGHAQLPFDRRPQYLPDGPVGTGIRGPPPMDREYEYNPRGPRGTYREPPPTMAYEPRGMPRPRSPPGPRSYVPGAERRPEPNWAVQPQRPGMVPGRGPSQQFQGRGPIPGGPEVADRADHKRPFMNPGMPPVKRMRSRPSMPPMLPQSAPMMQPRGFPPFQNRRRSPPRS